MFLLALLVIIELPLVIVLKSKHDYYYKLSEEMGSYMYRYYSELFWKLLVIGSIIVFFIIFVVLIIKVKYKAFNQKNRVAVVVSFFFTFGLSLLYYLLPHNPELFILINIAIIAMVYYNISLFLKSP